MDALAHVNGYGSANGFGSQGLSLYDELQYPIGHCASDWCSQFDQSYTAGSPLELQQVANSNPFDSDCGGAGGPSCNNNGDSGDLREWLPFAVTRHMTVLELYAVDADLAFDPCFCALSCSGGSCTSCGGANSSCTGSFSLNSLTPAQQFNYFQGDGTPAHSGVGLGHCDSSQTQSNAAGLCSYRDSIRAA